MPEVSFRLSSGNKHIAPYGAFVTHTPYTLDFDELLEIAQSRVTRSLTDAECKEYLHMDMCPVD